MSGTRITIELPVPERPTREERAKRQYDYLMDRAEYATDLFLANNRNEDALNCLRRMWAWMESIDDLPEHLIPIKQFIAPTIRQWGAGYSEENKECQE